MILKFSWPTASFRENLNQQQDYVAFSIFTLIEKMPEPCRVESQASLAFWYATKYLTKPSHNYQKESRVHYT